MDAAKALKSSLCQELETIDAAAAAAWGNLHVPAEDWLVGLGGASVVPGEDFSVDDLLDFSNGELEGEGEEEEEEEEEEEKESLSVSSSNGADDDSNSNSGSFSGNGEDSDSLLTSELAVPVEDIAELEWVSQFVDDSLSEFPIIQCPPCKWIPETSIVGHRAGPVFLKPPCFPTPVPVKSRTKRSRTGNKQTSLSQSSETSSTSSCTTWSSPSIDFLRVPHEEPERKKKKKKNTVSKPATQTGPVHFQRRCSHCLVQKTPQWRTGPLGPKTLCNACGVRYKSGRLFPEYRPACSPTFAVEIHSNSHRKVVEMRRKKELLMGPKSGLAQMVSSF